MKNLADTYQYKCHNHIHDERLPELIGCPEKTADEDPIETPEENKCHSQCEEIRIHHGVAPIHCSILPYRHPSQGNAGHQGKAAKLDQTDELEFSFYDILLRHRKEDGEYNIIRFPRALKAFINAKADEEDAIQNGITGYQEHQSKSNKQIGQW